MRIQINQLANQAVRLLSHSFSPSRSSQDKKVIVIALIAMAFLSAFFYYALRNPPATPNVTPPPNNPKSGPRIALDNVPKQDDLPKVNADPSPEPEDENAKVKSDDEGKPLGDEDAHPLDDSKTKRKSIDIAPADTDYAAAVEESRKLAQREEEEQYQTALLESQLEARQNDEDEFEQFPDMEEAIRQSKEELKKQQKGASENPPRVSPKASNPKGGSKVRKFLGRVINRGQKRKASSDYSRLDR